MSAPARVLMAMSGGVDSSVSALLLQRAGYEVVGVTMHLYCPDPDTPVGESSCCSLDDIDDARAVAAKLGIEHHVLNFTDAFERDVIERFCAGYEAGCTPNPCIDCNRYLKFGLLHQRRRELECDYLATGHYARIEPDGLGGYALLRGVDEAKDQSYVLACIPAEELAHTLFPLGGITKNEVRALAAEAGFVNAAKGESQDICFVPDGDYATFLESRGAAFEAGPIVDEDGRELGMHQGLARYTVGQRKGLGIGGLADPLYVIGKDAASNALVVGPRERLQVHELHATDVNVLGPLPADARVTAKSGYNQRPRPAIAELADGVLTVRFDDPHPATSPGQALVVYDGDRVIAGGTIL